MHRATVSISALAALSLVSAASAQLFTATSNGSYWTTLYSCSPVQSTSPIVTSCNTQGGCAGTAAALGSGTTWCGPNEIIVQNLHTVTPGMNSCGGGFNTNGSGVIEAPVVFSGPASSVTVQLQAHYEWDFSNFTGSAGMGPAVRVVCVSIGLVGWHEVPGGYCAGGAPLSGVAVLTSGAFSVPTGVPVQLKLSFSAGVASGDGLGGQWLTLNWNAKASLPKTGPVFILPEGFTANSPEIGLVNNSFPPPPPVSVVVTADTTQTELDSLTEVTGDLILAKQDGVPGLSLPNLVQVGGSIIITGNSGLITVGAPALKEVQGGIEIDDNPMLEVVDFGSLGGTTGAISIAGNNNPVVDFGSLGGTTGAISIAGNNNPVVDFGSLGGTTGAISIAGNNNPVVDLGALVDIGGDFTIANNNNPQLDLSALVDIGGDFTIANNDNPQVDLSALVDIGGDFTVTDNNDPERRLDGTPTHPLNFPSLESVGGDLTVSTHGQAVLDFALATVEGNICITGEGATEVLARSAGGSTKVELLHAESRQSMLLPPGTHETPSAFAVTYLDPASLPPESGVDAGGDAAIIDPVAGASYAFAAPTLDEVATLTITLDVAALDEATRLAVLTALSQGRLTVAVRGDEPSSVLTARAVCGDDVEPEPDGCIALDLLDPEGLPLPPRSEEPPAGIRATAKVSHFSSYHLAIVEPKPLPCVGDINGDRLVNGADLAILLGQWGRCRNCDADLDGNGVVDGADLAVVLGNWGACD
ncbi:MAG: hypothetical protein KF724_07075 [Phycisphaeraceae bacterium]|nr:hypothetical protein [Phycisphaeraceae bacterium]